MRPSVPVLWLRARFTGGKYLAGDGPGHDGNHWNPIELVYCGRVHENDCIVKWVNYNTKKGPIAFHHTGAPEELYG